MKHMFGVTSENKTYATAENAEKAILREYPEIRFMIVKLEKHNCSSPKYFGRYIPVAFGIDAIHDGVHWGFYVIA